MDYKKNLKYLKSNDVIFYIGSIPLIFGIVLFALARLFRVYIIPFQSLSGMLLAALGLALMYVPPSMHSNEDDLDNAVESHMNKLLNDTVNVLEKKLKTSVEPPVVLGRYVLDADGAIVRKGRKDQRYRSSLYSGAVIAFKKDGFQVVQSTLSLISDQNDQRVSEFCFADRPTAETAERMTALKGQGGMMKREYDLVISDGKGNEIRIPIVDSVLIDDLCERIRRGAN